MISEQELTHYLLIAADDRGCTETNLPQLVRADPTLRVHVLPALLAEKVSERGDNGRVRHERESDKSEDDQ